MASVESSRERLAGGGWASQSLEMRLLRDWTNDLAFARLGRGVRRDARNAAAHLTWVWLSNGLRPCRAPWRGVAQEGTAQLEVAMPTSPFPNGSRKGESVMEQVIIGVDPHKLSATIEVVDKRERLLGSGRFTTDKTGYAAMRSYVRHGRTGSGRLRAPTAPAGRWPNVWSRPASRLLMFRPSSLPGSGSSIPDTTARPTRWMLTRSPSSRSAPKGCGYSLPMVSWKH